MMSDQNAVCSDGTECAICGTSERPEKGWIYKSGDVRPREIDGELKFKAKDGAPAYCSTDCSRQSKSDQNERVGTDTERRDQDA